MFRARERGHFTLRRPPSAAVCAILPVIVLLGGMHATDAQSAVLVYGAVISSAQENPVNASTASGAGRFTIDTDANTVTYRIAFTGLMAAETAAHIHGFADPGVNGGVLHALPAGNPKVGVWNYLEAQEADILAGRTYANIHSAAFPGGEVRGQIVSHNARLDGGQEVPVVATTATGWGVFTIDTAANQLKYHVVFSGLSSAETAAHIHGFALHGTGAGVVFALAAGSPKTGMWNYLEAQEEDILAGRTYVNVHSANFPGGEIRGQISPIVVPIDGAQEVPGNGSTGAGVGLISYNLNTDDLSYDISYAGLSAAETAAHIHGFAAPGANAGVLVALPAGARKLGVWNFGAANEMNVTNGLSYINVHSAAFPGGELRGQIIGFPPSIVGVPDEAPPLAMSLAPSAPNPFRSTTRIGFRVEARTAGRLAIYDARGRLVRSLAHGDFAPGEYAFEWDGSTDDGRRVASGIYRYVLHTPRGELSSRVAFLK